MIAQAMGATPKGGKPTGFLTLGATADQWGVSGSVGSQPEGGFSYDDDYSSDGSGLGLLTARPAAWAVC